MYLYYIEETLIIILPLLGSIAFMTLAERKVMGLHKISFIFPYYIRLVLKDKFLHSPMINLLVVLNQLKILIYTILIYLIFL